MPVNEQQKEALEFFDGHARAWKDKAEGRRVAVNVIKQRNDFVLDVARRRDSTRTALDVGCGTGDLVHDLARRGVRALGVDFAPEMISIATRTAADEQLAGARFECASIFDLDTGGEAYDLIAANGFIEYISYDQLGRFFDFAAAALTPGGSLVFGSRNRLFNIISLNEFTRMEMEAGNLDSLMREAMALASGISVAAIADLQPAPLQPESATHAATGIGVTTRYQFTPAQLVRRVRERGLVPAEVFPIHVHGVPVRFKKANPAVHTSIAELLQAHAGDDLSLLPYASSFMIHATRPAE